jgi:hypothetical protein
MPIPWPVSENVFLPVTTQMVLSIPEIVYALRTVSIPELRSGVSLVPHAGDSCISVIRDWRDTIALRDSCHGVWTGTRERTSS